MMTGRFTTKNEFLFPLTLCNQDRDEVKVEATLDTGFSGHLILPREVVQRLDLPQDDYEEVLLAGGTIAQFSIHEVTVI